MTTYEWVHGEPPLTVEEPKLDFGDDDTDAENDASANVEIDFDLDMSTLDLTGVELEAPVDIDWGDLEDAGGDENVGDSIDWDAVDIVSEVQVHYPKYTKTR